MRELFIDCSNGSAGDMLSAALFELCPDRETALAELNALGIPGVEFAEERKESYSVMGTHMSVIICGDEEGGEEHHYHHHRGMKEIDELIAGLNVSEKVRNKISRVYQTIAAAETEVHGRTMQDIHFHELGTMDALADISAVCYMADRLGIDHITASPLCTGFGTVRCAHGLLPVPAPATAIIVKDMPTFAGNIEGERCTPTGAALIKQLADSFGNAPEMTVSAIGYGIGKKDFGRLNAVRVILGECEEMAIELSCNVDDMSPEAIGFAIDELLKAGAADAFYTPIGMKKNRPGVLLSVICRENMRDEMVRLMFRHTSTIGIRETLFRRYVLKRREETVETEYGPVRIKTSEGFGTEKRKAEYDDLVRIARDADMTLDEVRALTETK